MKPAIVLPLILGIVFILGGLVRNVIEPATVVLGVTLILYALLSNKLDRVISLIVEDRPKLESV